MIPVKRFSTLPATEKAVQIAAWLEEGKGRDVAVIELHNAVTDVALVVSATSARHAQGLADAVLARCKTENFELLRVEGFQLGEWILLDMNDVLVHIFQAPVRELFAVENLWRGKAAKDAQQEAAPEISGETAERLEAAHKAYDDDNTSDVEAEIKE